MTDTVASTLSLQELTPLAPHASNVAIFPLHTLNFSLGSSSESQALHLAIQRFSSAQSISPLHARLHPSLSISSQPQPFPSISQGPYLPKFTFLPTPPCCRPSSTVSWFPLCIFIRLACSLSLPSFLLLRVKLSIPCIPFCHDLFAYLHQYPDLVSNSSPSDCHLRACWTSGCAKHPHEGFESLSGKPKTMLCELRLCSIQQHVWYLRIWAHYLVKIYHQDGQVDLFCSNGLFKNFDSKLEYRASLPSEKHFLALQSTHDKGRSTFFAGVQLSAWCQKGHLHLWCYLGSMKF